MLSRRRQLALPLMILAVPFGAIALATTASLLTPQCSLTGASPEISAPGSGTAGMVKYLAANGLSGIAAAGVVGNLEQENGLSPSGQGIAQWGAGWYAAMAAYASSRGLSPTSVAGQLAYIAYDLQTNAGGWIHETGLLQKLNTAPDPATAATRFETGYENCRGVNGWMNVTPGSLCMDANRRTYAQQAYTAAGGSAVAGTPVSLTSGTQCQQASLVSATGYTNPFAHTLNLRPNRIDMGVDYDGTGEIDALGNSTVTSVSTGDTASGWVCNTNQAGQIVYQLHDGPDAGRYVYTAEDITPSIRTGQQLAAGQQIGTFTAPHTCIETGWSTTGTSANPEAADLGQNPAGVGMNQTYCGDLMSATIAATPHGIAGLANQPKAGTSCPPITH